MLVGTCDAFESFPADEVDLHPFLWLKHVTLPIPTPTASAHRSPALGRYVPVYKEVEQITGKNRSLLQCSWRSVGVQGPKSVEDVTP